MFFLVVVRIINVKNIFLISICIILAFPLKVNQNSCLYNKENL